MSDRSVLLLIWGITFLLYLPAIKAGWVIDAAGWLAHVQDKSEGLTAYLNRSWSTIPGMYQFTQLITLGFYKVWGVNPYAWSLLYELLHTFNAFLFFVVFRAVLTDSGYDVSTARKIALTTAVLFTICPHISEVLIWKACYHYLQGFLMILICLYCFVTWQRTKKFRYVVLSALVFLCSVFTLEYFYLTPLFLFSFAVYYAVLPTARKGGFVKSVGYFVVPQTLAFVLYGYLFHKLYPGAKPHVYNLISQSFSDYFSKGPKYLFHVLLLGRFYSFPTRLFVYRFCESAVGMVLSYGICFWLAIRVWRRGCSGEPYYRVQTLIIVLATLSLIILFPLAFPDQPLLVFYDRYLYVAAPFLFLIICLWVYHTPKKFIAAVLFIGFAGCNLYRTIQLNLLWKHANYVTNRLLTEFPDPGSRTVLLLNAPGNMNGAAMIGAAPDGAWKTLRKVLLHQDTPASVYEVLSYNLTGLHDACRVFTLNDSMLYVSFNQVGNWWTYNGLGAKDYTNAEYTVALRRWRNDYVLTLKHPWSHYLILNDVDGNWVPVKFDPGPRDYFDDREFNVVRYQEWKLCDGERGAFR